MPRAIASPTEVSGLIMWLTPDAGVTQAGSGISVMADQSGSGSGLNATQTVDANRPTLVPGGGPNGRNAANYVFASSQFFNLPTLAALTEGSLFIVIKPNSITAVQQCAWKMGSAAGAVHIPSNTGLIYDEFGSTVRKDLISPVPQQLLQWTVYSARSGAGKWDNWINGQRLFVTTTNTVGFSATPTIGYSSSVAFGGRTAAVLLYNRFVTDNERVLIERWLRDYYGLKNYQNYVTYSEELDNAAWNKTRVTITPDATTAPDGNATADRVVEVTGAASTHTVDRTLTQARSPAGIWTWSGYFKAGERPAAMMVLYDVGASVILGSASFDLTSGAVAYASGALLDARSEKALQPNGTWAGWWRCWITAASAPGIRSWFFLQAAAGATTSYAGDDTKGLYAWGLQLVRANWPGPYTQTAAASVLYPLDSRENTRQNLFTYSEALDNAAWTKMNTTITADATTAPDGNATADKVVETVANATHTVNRSDRQPATTPIGMWTYSFYAKAAERTRIALSIYQNSAPAAHLMALFFDLATGTTLPLASSVPCSYGMERAYQPDGSWNGWYRCWVTALVGSGITVTEYAYLCNAAGATTYVGDITKGLYLWGGQLVFSNWPGVYTKTDSWPVQLGIR